MGNEKIKKLKEVLATKKIVTVAGLAAVTLVGTSQAAQAQNNGDSKLQGKVVIKDNTVDIAKKVEQEFKNLAGIKVEKKDGVNLSGEKLHSEEYGTKYGRITHYTHENGSTETEFACEHGSMILRNGSFFNKKGQKIDSEEAADFLRQFEEFAIKGQPTIFMSSKANIR